MGDKRFAEDTRIVRRLFPHGRGRQMRSAAFLASGFRRFSHNWRVGITNRTFRKFPEPRRKNHCMEPHPSAVRFGSRKGWVFARSRSQMRGVRFPSHGIGQKQSPENSRPGEQRDEKNGRLVTRGVHMQTFRLDHLSKSFAIHSVPVPDWGIWGTNDRQANSNTWILSGKRGRSDRRRRYAREKERRKTALHC